ncbi:MAG: hypothetical protein ACJ74Z_18045 [Bryobacteraceae bacterium]
MIVALVASGGTPNALSLYSGNTHYFLFRGKPTVLVTSGEHYGSVINAEFNYRRYLDELKRNHLNLTRIWVGPYREVPGDFNIADNTLAPRADKFVPPWPRSSTAGAADGGNRFDLSQWNPAYFARLHDFVREASLRGIVVEVNLFCPYYEKSMWAVSPLNSANNVNGIGNVDRTEVLTMKHPSLLSVEDVMVRKIVIELNAFDNLYYEICNEPYFGGVTLDWQQHISRMIVSTEETLPNHHLISQNVANGSKVMANSLTNVSIFNFHYSRPPASVSMNYELRKVIGNNETGFDGPIDATYRIQGWDFLAAGGAVYNNLDYSFTVGHEGGDFQYGPQTPGGGSATLRKQLGIMKDLFDSIDLTQLRPANSLVRPLGAKPASMRVLASPDDYVVYIHEAHISGAKLSYTIDSGPQQRSFAVELPKGVYGQLWLDTKTGAIGNGRIHHTGGERVFQSPIYSEDIVLRIQRIGNHR